MNYLPIDHLASAEDTWIGYKATFNLFRAIFHQHFSLTDSDAKRRDEKTFRNAFLFVELSVLLLFVSNFYGEIYIGIYVCRMVDENSHSFDEDSKKINVYLNLNI